MSFKPTKKDLQRSAICPVGMHLVTAVAVGKEYLNEGGTQVQQVDFETSEGYIVPKWFWYSVKKQMLDPDVLKFVQAADNMTFDLEKISDDGEGEDALPEIELKDYEGKKVAISVSHQKDKNGKVQPNIDEFFTADSVPF